MVPLVERKKMNDLKINKISYYIIQDMVYHLGVTDKWKYLEALEYEKKKDKVIRYKLMVAFFPRSVLNFCITGSIAERRRL